MADTVAVKDDVKEDMKKRHKRAVLKAAKTPNTDKKSNSKSPKAQPKAKAAKAVALAQKKPISLLDHYVGVITDALSAIPTTDILHTEVDYALLRGVLLCLVGSVEINSVTIQQYSALRVAVVNSLAQKHETPVVLPREQQFRREGNCRTIDTSSNGDCTYHRDSQTIVPRLPRRQPRHDPVQEAPWTTSGLAFLRRTIRNPPDQAQCRLHAG